MIANTHKLDKSTVCRILNDDQAKEIIQRIHDMHLSAATDIQGNIISIAKTKPGDNDKIKTSDILMAAKEHNQIIGIASSHTPSNVFIGKYYQQNNTLSASVETLNIVSDVARSISGLAQVPQDGDDDNE
jgi:hypothetical protein